MKKAFSIALFASVIGITAVQAAVYKGQQVYQKRCKKCHDSELELTKTYTSDEWGKLMADKGEGLGQLHIQTAKAENSWRYFRSKKYKKRVKHLKDYLSEYAKDKEKIPAGS